MSDKDPPSNKKLINIQNIEPSVAILGGIFALVIPAVVAIVGYAYAVQQLQADFDTKTCDLQLKVNVANARIKHFELDKERQSVPEPNEFFHSKDEVKEIEKRRSDLDLEMKRMKRIAKYYTEAQENGLQSNCNIIMVGALKL